MHTLPPDHLKSDGYCPAMVHWMVQELISHLMKMGVMVTKCFMQLSLLCPTLPGWYRRWDIIGQLSNSLLQGQSLSSNQYYTYVQMCSKNPTYKANAPPKGILLGSNPLQYSHPSPVGHNNDRCISAHTTSSFTASYYVEQDL